MRREAMFSLCHTWRYRLSRTWLDHVEPLVVIGLNPSTADETVDDPTIRRCVGYAMQWGYGGLVMLNLFAFRATDPQAMKAAADPVGPDNDAVLLSETMGRTVLCAWGAHGVHRDRASKVIALLRWRSLRHLGLTKNGQPKHPLYLRADEEPRVWQPAGGAA